MGRGVFMRGLFGRGLAMTLALLPLACQSQAPFTLLGYQIGSRYECDIRTIKVPIFRNFTYWRDAEFELTQAVVSRIEAVTPWKVVQSEAADTELVGTIVNVQKRVILPNPLNEVREADFTMAVEVKFLDKRTGRNLMRPLSGPEMDEIPAPMVDPLAPPALAAAARPATLIQRSASFVPELGESLATARQRVIRELAVQIVNMMEMPW